MSRSKYYDKTSSQWVHSEKSGLPAGVFPTFDDLRVNLSEKSLQIKANPSKQLKDCELKEVVYLYETVNDVTTPRPYIVVEKNDDNIVLLRQYIVDSGQVGSANRTFFQDGAARIWCDTTFQNRFSENTKKYFTTKAVQWITSDYPSIVWGTYLKTVFIPSVYELGGTPKYTDTVEGTSVWFNNNTERMAYLETNTINKGQYWTRTFNGTTGSPSAINNHQVVNTSGSFGGASVKNTNYYRPAIVFVPETPIDADNQLVDSIVYDSTLEMVRSGGKLYDLKDLDAREAITDLETEMWNKQDSLIAGDNIDITNNTISVPGVLMRTDLRIDNGTDFVINSNVTYLKDMGLGATIYVPETINNVVNYMPYTLVEKRTNSSIILCRNNLLPTTTNIYSHNGDNKYFELDDVPTANLLDEYIESTYMPRLSNSLKLMLVNEIFSVDDKNGVHNCTRKVTIPLDTEVSSWNFNKAASIEFQSSPNQIYYTRKKISTGSWSGYQYNTMRVVNASGNFDTANTDNSKYIRPIIAISETATINDTNNYLITIDNTYELTQIDNIRYNNKAYKIKDIDAREALNKPPYDIGYFADANVIIDDTTTTSGLTISNQTFVVYQDMNTLLSKVNTYKSLNICGGFTTDMTQSMGYNFIAPATISHIMPVPNAVAAQLIPDIGTKDAIAVRISPIYRQSLFVDTWGIYEDTNGEVKTVAMNN